MLTVPAVLAAISYHPIVHIPLGPLRISPHGIGIAVGFLAGARLMLPAARARGIDEDTVYSLLTRAAIGAIIGARVAFVANHLSEYSSPIEMIKVWEGGISLLGGIFGAILLALPLMRRKGLSFWQVMDAAAPGMALGIVIGRIGDLVVGDHLGKTTSFFLGYKCPADNIATASDCAPTEFTQRTAGAIVHQPALYDFFLTIGLLVLLLQLRKVRRFDGFLIMVFAAWYATGRILEDFLREDLRRLGLTGSQWTALITLAVALFGLFRLRSTPGWGQWDRVQEVDDLEAGAIPAGLDDDALDDDALDDDALDDDALDAPLSPDASAAGTGYAERTNHGDEQRE
ncbi:MAG TPA: prolipoprotein diacylglyceryl transferase [Acidimicrobiales bacterium]|nr:prolipoprotein diacylglyceryl transferase [Acidimicrobiales bacterium]